MEVENFTELPPSFEKLDKLQGVHIGSKKGKILPKVLTKLKSLGGLGLWGEIFCNLTSPYEPDKQSKEVLEILRDKNVELFSLY